MSLAVLFNEVHCVCVGDVVWRVKYAVVDASLRVEVSGNFGLETLIYRVHGEAAARLPYLDPLYSILHGESEWRGKAGVACPLPRQSQLQR